MDSALTSAGGAHYARHFRHFAKTKSPKPEGGERRRQRRSVRFELAGFDSAELAMPSKSNWHLLDL